MITLRDYQSDAIEAGLSFLSVASSAKKKSKKTKPATHGVLVEPTGAGKSLIIAGIVSRLDAPALVFQPSAEILEQNAEKLRGYGIEPAIYSASCGSKRRGDVTLATIGSVRKTPEIFHDVRYVIVDECHAVNPKEGMYREFLAALGSIRALGLTATPYRLAAAGQGASIQKFLTRTRPRVFETVVHYTQIGDLVRDGFLARPTYQSVPSIDRAGLQWNGSGSDYTDASVRRQFAIDGFSGKLARIVKRLRVAGRQHVLVFTRFVDEAFDLAAALPGVVEVVTADTPPAVRRLILQRFRAGVTPVVANVGVLTTGFDFPALDTVVLARPTASLALYYQMVGRVVRPFPGVTKWVVDMVDVVDAFGKVEDLTLRPNGKRGQSWEIVSGDRVLTNVRMVDGQPVTWTQSTKERMYGAA